MQPDSVLVKLVRDGQMAVYEKLVARYQRSGMVTALRVLRNHHAAEDVVQESFLTAYQRLDTLRDASKFGPWFMKIVARRALRESRMQPAETPLDSVAPPEVGSGSEWEACQRLMEWINRLPLHERVVVVLRHLDGHSTREIAEITGRPVGTVRKQLSRAVKRLRYMAAMQESSR